MNVSMKKNSNSGMLVAQTMDKFTSDITKLHNQKESAISSFRKTANELEQINQDIDKNVGMMDAMIDYLANEKKGLTQQHSDNKAIQTKILEIIGE